MASPRDHRGVSRAADRDSTIRGPSSLCARQTSWNSARLLASAQARRDQAACRAPHSPGALGTPTISSSIGGWVAGPARDPRTCVRFGSACPDSTPRGRTARRRGRTGRHLRRRSRDGAPPALALSALLSREQRRKLELSIFLVRVAALVWPDGCFRARRAENGRVNLVVGACSSTGRPRAGSSAATACSRTAPRELLEATQHIACGHPPRDRSWPPWSRSSCMRRSRHTVDANSIRTPRDRRWRALASPRQAEAVAASGW